MTRFQYDPYGRVKTLTAPDGTETTLAYTGVRLSSSTTKVRTSASQETNATTTTEYDAEGRMLRVTDPAGIKTKYTYDVAGRLTEVCANEDGGCTQERVFTYDNRGFLTEEQTPELGANGNGTASYKYDARGNVVRKTIGAALGAFDVKSEYDRAGRLKRIYEAGTDRTLKMFEYGSANSGSDYRHGRLTRAIRYNWMNSLGYNVQVIEDYTYAGREGRVSARTTLDSECEIAASSCNSLFAGTEKRSFAQTFTYDELGAVTSATHPSCTIGDCAAAAIPGRSVTNSYEDGQLTGVTWTSAPQAASIEYHDNGMMKKVIHANQVVDEILLDSQRIPRPYEIKTSNVLDPATCTLPTFATQPLSSTIASSASVTLTAKAVGQTGAAITYRWYRGTYPDSSTLVKTETPASGADTTLATGALTATTSYWVKATNSCQTEGIASQTATVTICTVPSIASQPQGDTITLSQSHTLSVGVSGSTPMSYQWSTMSGTTATPIAGATSSALIVTPTSTTTYRVTISNACGSLNSVTALVTVHNPPTAPSTITATSDGSKNTVTWSSSSSVVGIDYYEVERQDGLMFTIQMPGTKVLTNGPSGVTPGSAYLYRVRGVDENGVAGPWSVEDLTTTIAFTDDPLQIGTEAKGIHVGQLRQAIDAVRTKAGLPTTWAGQGSPTGVIPVGHVTVMRSKLNEARLALGLPAVAFAEPNLSPNGLYRASYLNELRNGVQ